MDIFVKKIVKNMCDKYAVNNRRNKKKNVKMERVKYRSTWGYNDTVEPRRRLCKIDGVKSNKPKYIMYGRKLE